MTNFRIGKRVWIDERDEYATVVGFRYFGFGGSHNLSGTTYVYRLKIEGEETFSCYRHQLLPAEPVSHLRLVWDADVEAPCDTETAA